MSKTRFRHLATTAALAACCAATPALAASNASSPTHAQILLDAQLRNTHPLDFGRIVRGPSGGALSINAATGTVTTVGDIVRANSIAHRARFTSKAPLAKLLLPVVDPTVTLIRQGGTETMTATLTVARGAGIGLSSIPGLLRATATEQEYLVGGTLFVGGSQAEGVYEGTFNLTVSFL